MVTWQAFETESPELASFGRERIHRRVSFLATIRADGGPRVHPVTPWIFDGHLYVRMFETSPKVADLTRDPRYALHSMMDNDDGIGGEVALRGRGRAGAAIRRLIEAAFSAVADFTSPSHRPRPPPHITRCSRPRRRSPTSRAIPAMRCIR